MALLLRDGRVATDGGVRERDVLVEGETVAAVEGDIPAQRAGDDGRVLDCSDRLVLPGAVDVHVHFRDPGFTYKEDWTTGSSSALAGGVTTVVDQPNTEPPTVTGAAFDAKRRRAETASAVDFGIDAGVTADWRPSELAERPVAAHGEVFLADSTGDMGISMELFEDALDRIYARPGHQLVTVHAEDSSLFEPLDSVDRPGVSDAWSEHRPAEAEVAAVERAIDVAGDRPLHFAHVSHPDSVDLIADTVHSCEVTPHHLLLSRDDCEDLGTYGKMNPPLRSEAARAGLMERLVDGRADCVATDHAPHAVSEKEQPLADAPSGVPGVETMVPLLLALARRDDHPLTVERVAEATAAAPAAIFDFDGKGVIEEGADADLAVYPDGAETRDAVDPVDPDALHSKAGWTPFAGRDAVFPDVTVRRGDIVYGRGDEHGGFALTEGRLVS